MNAKVCDGCPDMATLRDILWCKRNRKSCARVRGCSRNGRTFNPAYTRRSAEIRRAHFEATSTNESEGGK